MAENQLLLAAIVILLGSAVVPPLLQTRWARDCRALADVTPPTAGAEPSAARTRLNERYHWALQLAELITSHRSIEHRIGNVVVRGFVLDMWKVFEDFLMTTTVGLNLNGRSTRITTTVIHDEGPSLNFIRHEAHCREVVPGPILDTSCGINYMGSRFTVSEASPRFNYGPAQGSNIVDAGTYFIEGRMQFQPSGCDYVWSIPTTASVWGSGTQSERFICPTQNRVCYFNR
ncbi:hypothetical protein EEB12_29480 [Rhodococcus sp. WS1]|uniref:5-methylcytosine restriction system specificity protein McrC n=1 Tax=unclassified Rhodococcus (in: high G+C Gram-positive bacteria) TaxID=192944 RepID=UPI0011447DEA|nr:MULTISPECIES: hypothetical protein [unclassified Rhodococcus (in: high G+C Gram-positive bacteria)]ROZ52952.1 hypothetical protein EEB12_29480 [Rhodococcus sp. WS1]TQC36042.1 hypothetical protein EEB16_21050 [Rhodococcus sp. WS7]